MVINSTLQLILQHPQTQLTETLNPFITHLTSFSQYGLRLTLTCIHVGLIVFVSIHMPRNSHSDWRNGWWVHHCRDECCTPQQSLTIVVPGRIHALMMTSNVSAERSATGARQVSPILACHQQQPRLSRATGRNYTFVEVSILYFQNIATPTNHH